MKKTDLHSVSTPDAAPAAAEGRHQLLELDETA